MALLCGLVSCDTETRVERTIPADGQQNVHPRTIIAVRLDDIMTAADENNTDSRNIVVTGDQTEGVYSGTIEKAHHSEVFNGQTVEEFRNRRAQPSEGEDGSTEEKGQDTLVFLLDGGVEFKPGEVVTVFVSKNITTRGLPLERNRRFSFTVRGGASLAEGDLFVTETLPLPEDRAAGLRPSVTARFSLPVETQGVESGITLRGEQSGAHAELRIVTPSESPPSEITVKLPPGDLFLPGETVSATWNSAVRAAGGGGGLAPYLLRFHVRPGRVTKAPAELEPPRATAPIRGILALDLFPEVPGVELVVLTERSLELYRQTGPGVWQPSVLEFPEGETFEGAAALDMDEDGVPEIAVVVSGGGTFKIRSYGAGDAESLEERGDPVEFPAAGIDGVAVADLDSDGLPELIVAHGNTTFTPEAGAGLPEVPGLEPPAASEENAPEETGHLTFFRVVPAVPDLGNLNDPDSLLTFTFERVARPIPRFPRARRLEAHDLDGDGRLDLIAETDEGLVLYRNQSSSSSPFAFRRAGALEPPEAAGGLPRAWIAYDADSDHDIDVVAWDADGALFYENRQPRGPRSRDLERALETEPRGLLFEKVEPVRIDVPAMPLPGHTVFAANWDGDEGGVADLLVLEDGGVVLLRGSGGDVFDFERLEGFAPAGGVPPVFADLNGDAGLDVALASGRRLRFLLTDPADVVPPPLPQPSSFRLVEVAREGDELVAAVVGDIRTPFSGYGIALDYDENLLVFEAFDPPASLERRASFNVCPGPSGLGCEGRVGVRMTYLQGVVGAPADGIELGRFRFRLEPVTQRTEARIELADFTEGSTAFANVVTALEDGTSEDLPVADTGEPLVVILEPPPPPRFEIACAVLERKAASYRAEVMWTSPRGEAFSRVAIRVGGDTLLTAPWEDGRIEFEDDHAGVVTLQASALGPDDSAEAPPPDAPEQSCTLVSVFRPDVLCISEGGVTIVRWTLSHTAERFNVYRNGALVAVVGGNSEDFLYEDPSPSPDGADIYQVAAVVQGVEGPRGSCRGRDPNPCTTQDPVALSAVWTTLTPQGGGLGAGPAFERAPYNALRFRWRNAEAYDRLVAVLSHSPSGRPEDAVEIFPGGLELEPDRTEFLYEADPDRGGALPGTYLFSLRAFVADPDGACGAPGGEVSSSQVFFTPVTVPEPGLETIGFACAQNDRGGIDFTWGPLWGGFEPEVELRVFRRTGGEEEQIAALRLLRSQTAYELDAVEPLGVYRAELAAFFDGREFLTTCGPVPFEPTLTAPQLDAGIGRPFFEIPITGRGIFATLSGASFEIEYPAEVTIEGEELLPAPSGRKRARIEILDRIFDPDPDGDGRTTGELEIVRLRASAPADFSLAARGALPLRIDQARIRFLGSDTWYEVPAVDGSLRFRERYVLVERKEIDAGVTEPVRVAVRLTFTAPPQKPDYRFNAFTIHLRFPPELLELVPPTLADQATTAVAGEGFYIFPTPETLAQVNRTGDLKVGWIGFDFSDPTSPDFLEPVTDAEVLVLRFRSRLGPDAPSTFAPVTFVTDPRADQPTAFFPDEDVPGVPDVEVFFDGGIAIRAIGPQISLVAVEPPRGPLSGGTFVTLRGTGFPEDEPSRVRVRFEREGAEPVVVPEEDIAVESDRRIRVRVPDSGLRNPAGADRVAYDVVLEVDNVVRRLAAAFFYEAPRLFDADVLSVRASGGDKVRLLAQGLPPDTRAAFDVDGLSVPVDLEVESVDPDGRGIVFAVPLLPGPRPGEEYRPARLRIIVPGVATLVFPRTFKILPGEGGAEELAIERVSPQSAVHCGGEEVTVEGRGFGEGTRVFFAGVEASEVLVRSPRELVAVVPLVPEPGEAVLRVERGALGAEVPFTLEPPPEFIRGDANGDGTVDVTDAVVLAELVLNQRGTPPPNRDALDVNDDGSIDFGDAIALLSFLMEGGTPPAPPFPEPGSDPNNLEDGICR